MEEDRKGASSGRWCFLLFTPVRVVLGSAVILLEAAGLLLFLHSSFEAPTVALPLALKGLAILFLGILAFFGLFIALLHCHAPHSFFSLRRPSHQYFQSLVPNESLNVSFSLGEAFLIGGWHVLICVLFYLRIDALGKTPPEILIIFGAGAFFLSGVVAAIFLFYALQIPMLWLRFRWNGSGEAQKKAAVLREIAGWKKRHLAITGVLVFAATAILTALQPIITSHLLKKGIFTSEELAVIMNDPSQEHAGCYLVARTKIEQFVLKRRLLSASSTIFHRLLFYRSQPPFPLSVRCFSIPFAPVWELLLSFFV